MSDPARPPKRPQDVMVTFAGTTYFLDHAHYYGVDSSGMHVWRFYGPEHLRWREDGETPRFRIGVLPARTRMSIPRALEGEIFRFARPDEMTDPCEHTP